MSRNIGEVVDRILEVIPEEETWLIKCLNKIMKDISYSPPEAVGRFWGELGERLSFSIKELNKDEWKVLAASILTDMTVDDFLHAYVLEESQK